MANFTKSTQTALGLINVGAAIGNAFGLGSRLSTPTNSQGRFNSVREQALAGIRQFGIQKTNMAYVEFGLPPILQGVDGMNSQVLLLARHRAAAFPTPGTTFATSEIKRYGVGPVERKPYLPLFNDIPVEFIGDSRGNIHKFFYVWLNSIINFIDLPYDGAFKDKFGGVSKNPFSLEFKDNYKTRLLIRSFDDAQGQLTSVYLEDAFPVSISDIQHNWNDENTLVRFTVNFSYTHWKYDLEDRNFAFNLQTVESKRGYQDIIRNFLNTVYPVVQAIEGNRRR